MVDDIHQALFSEDPGRVLSELEDFIATFSRHGCSFVLTSDSNLADQCRLDCDATDALIDEFSSDDIVDFVDRWCSNWVSESGENAPDAVLRIVAEDSRLGDLSRTPLLATMVAAHVTLSGARVDSMLAQETACHALLGAWERGPGWAGWEKRESLLKLAGELALRALSGQGITQSVLCGLSKDAPYGQDAAIADLNSLLLSLSGLISVDGSKLQFRHSKLPAFLAGRRMSRMNPTALKGAAGKIAEGASPEVASAAFLSLVAVSATSSGEARKTRLVIEDLLEVLGSLGLTRADKIDLLAPSIGQLGGDSATMVAGIRDSLLEVLSERTASPPELIRSSWAIDTIGDTRTALLSVSEMELCLVHGGEVVAGAMVPCRLQVESFLMARFPVTNAQFQEFVARGGYSDSANWTEEGVAWRDAEGATGSSLLGERFRCSSQPVVGVTWYEARAFCSWLNRWANAEGWVPQGWEVRLPSEGQWMCAARGAAQVPIDYEIARLRVAAPLLQFGMRQVPFTDNPSPDRHVPWIHRRDYPSAIVPDAEAPFPVGCFPHLVSPYGCEDMGGTVWQWLSTRWGGIWEESSFALCPEFGEPDAREASDGFGVEPRAVRGGSFLIRKAGGQEAEHHLDIDYRARNFADIRHVTHGFRVALCRRAKANGA